jgi:hypothetical protein
MNADADGDDLTRDAAGQSGPRPRNYLASRERRRIFWMFMPPAVAAVLLVGWLERLWSPAANVPAPGRFDTVLANDPRPALAPGDVLIEQPTEPEQVPATADKLSAAPELLAQIKDDSLHRSEELPAWIQTFLTLRSSDRKALRAAAQPVAFGELFGQPRSFRGRPVRFSGKLHSLERRRAPANDYGIEHYWESWIEPADGGTEPIVVHSLDGPAELQPSGRHTPVGGWLLGYALLGVVVATGAIVMGFGLGLVGPQDRHRPVADPADLEATLAGADIMTASEALQRLEADHRSADRDLVAKAPPPSP